MKSQLFHPLSMGDLTLPNRVVMAPLTRARAGESRVPNELMREYYVQRASAGLILSEATSISAQGVGYAGTPGIWSPAQVAGWKIITAAVHDAGGRIFSQLWHVGRISHPRFLNGELPVAPSAIAAKGKVSLVRPAQNYPTPRALETAEIIGIIEDYRHAAQNALEAGFDGVELHGANGYLIDQFLRDGSNHRTDQYGGTLENRARFLLEATDAAIAVWGKERVGVHLSPRNEENHTLEDSNPAQIFNFAAREMGKRGIAFLFTREPFDDQPRLSDGIRRNFGGVMIANQGFTLQSAETLLEQGRADAVSWGQQFIANPDLPRRLREDAPLNPPNPATFYAPGPQGYTDYPAL